MIERIRTLLVPVLGVILSLFTLAEVNYPNLQQQSRLAVFGLLGIVLCFLIYPVHPKLKDNRALRWVDFILAAASVVCFGYIIVQSEPMFERFWQEGQSLGDRAGMETTTDFWIGLLGLFLVLEATRRSIGLALPILAIAFVLHAYYGEVLPDWLLPHAQKKVADIVNVTFLQSLGVFGPAMGVMFTYVFLFVVFGAFLEATGATQFIVDFAERVFARSPGGPAKVSVLGSGLMGSLSGSAVANAVTTGAFTIPMMRNAGFKPHIAGGITAAAASGGALVPPVMGAGAYMMLEIVDPPIDSFLTIAKAALIPAILYYFSIFMIVHFYAQRSGTAQGTSNDKTGSEKTLLQLMMQFEGVVFFGALFSLIAFLILGYSPFRAVTYSLGVIVVLGLVHPRQRLTLGMSLDAMIKSAKNGVSLVSASACVGIVIGIVQTTGVAGDFNTAIAGVVEESLLLALIGIMVSSIILGMGVPSVVCYLLMATLMGNLLKELGVIPLAAHLFIFYFGMMSMVTPPVALAAFASASIAQANIMRTALASFMFALVGFTLPFMFIYRPELLLMSNKPEVRVASFSIEETNGEPMAATTAYLEKSTVGQPEETVEISQVGQTADVQSVQTNTTGQFRCQLTPGQWEVAVFSSDSADENAEAKTRVVLGVLNFDPARIREKTTDTDEAKSEKTEDERVLFDDQRLSLLQVAVATTAGALGILILAAGIAGYMIGPMNVVLRGLSFVTAALLLFPDRGFLVGGLQIAISDVAGLVLLGVIAVINSQSKGLPVAEEAAKVADEESSSTDDTGTPSEAVDSAEDETTADDEAAEGQE